MADKNDKINPLKSRVNTLGVADRDVGQTIEVCPQKLVELDVVERVFGWHDRCRRELTTDDVDT